MAPRVRFSPERLAEMCRRWKVRELSVFGSVLRDDCRPESDVDVLVEFDPGTHWRYYELMEMREDVPANR